ncbi:MFS transporter [Candidatus Cerribacteria bacterium 'Amazon FNV 2010 28 9']|uniref:MFS transporter n=1 Tax=Candidatus Cerribacteria bacterium 'Amazon FNV 2010 28 9' TaxID=2081795 RepID=A0A317JQL7_9BACT|nr:MAG: MFS transporter [Candidatus Cerribacteria bacterium 'Amazon FNV 2010 28 9']
MSGTEKIRTYHWTLFAICFFGTAFAGVISTLMSVYLPVAVADLLGTKNETELNNISAYINSVFIFGGAFGGFISGVLTDKAGRKAAVIFSIACYGLFTILTGFMPNWWAVVICRFFSGFGLGAILVTAPTIMLEEWPEKTRAIFIGILSIGIPVGIFSAGVINYFVSSWREGFLVGIIPLSISIISLFLVKESPKWKYDQQQVARNKKKNEKIFSADHQYDLVKGSIIFGAMLIGLWAIFSWIPTWLQTLITTGDGQKERGLSMMMLGMGGLMGGFLSGWVMNAIGARRAMLLCFSVCTALSFVLFKTNSSFSPLIYVEIAIMSFFFGISQGVLSVYIPNLFPVNIRGTATGFCFNIGRVITATAVLFVGVLVTALGGYGNSLFIFSLVFVIGLIATILSKDSTEKGPGEHRDVEVLDSEKENLLEAL